MRSEGRIPCNAYHTPFYKTAKNGVVIATDRKVASVLVDSEEYQKIQNITPTTGMNTAEASCVFH
jgi:hypothetical protein